MDLNFKLGSKNLSSAFEMREFPGFLSKFWQKAKSPLFLIFLLSMVGLGGYIWWKNLYGSGWSEAEKQEYIDTQNKSVVLNDNDFKKVIENIQARKEVNGFSRDDLKDIFKKY